jgi:hypothetical protein
VPGDRDLEAALRSLGARLDVPDPPPVTAAVLARLDARLDEVPPAARGWRPVHRVLAAAAAALVALATAMAVSPAVRAAVQDLLRVGGVEIHENQRAPVTPTGSVDPPLPGERDVTLDGARDAVAFPLKLPAGLGEPTSVRVAGHARAVSMAFHPPSGTASGPQSGTVRVDQFDGGLDPMFAKFTSAADIHHVTVGGAPAVWVDRPHPVFYLDAAGVPREESARLAGSTLIWERDGITYRVEGDLTEEQAIAVATSLR